MIELTARAREVLAKASSSARRFDPEARVRIAREGAGIRSGFAHGPEAGDEVIEEGDLVVFVEGELSGVVDVAEPHDHLILRPEGGG